MSELRSAIDEFGVRDVADKPDAMLEEDFAELQRASELLEAERLRHLAEIDRRGIHRRDGHLSAASWLATSFRVGWGQAKAELRTARVLEEMPETRTGTGERGRVAVGSEAAGGCQGDRPRGVHAMRTRAGRGGTCPSHARPAAGAHPVAPDGRSNSAVSDATEELRSTRRLFTSRTFGGMVRVDGDLDPETGETLLTALRAIMDAEARSGAEDMRSPAQRRADALGEVCRQWLDRSDRPQVGGERPHVTVTVSADEPQRAGGIGRARPRGTGAGGGGEAAGVRRLDRPGGDGRDLRASGPRTEDAGALPGAAPGRDPPGRPLPVPGLRPPAGLVRRPPHPALARRRADRSVAT